MQNSSKTLEVLKLQSMFYMDDGSAFECFPRLKCFHLHLKAENYMYAGLYTETGPFCFADKLEEFSIYGDPGLNFFESLSVSAPRLKTYRLEFPDVNDLHYYYSFHIAAKDLKRLEIKENFLSKFHFQNMASLVKDPGDLDVYEEEKEEADDPIWRANDFFTAISTVQYLPLSWNFHEDCTVPTFNNVIKLKLIHFGNDYWSRKLMKLLEKSPNLQCLEIDDGYYPILEDSMVTGFPDEVDEVKLEWIPPKSVPNCLQSKLKSISMRGFKGKRCSTYLDEMEVTKHLLEDSQVLEKMTIYTSDIFPKRKIL